MKRLLALVCLLVLAFVHPIFGQIKSLGEPKVDSFPIVSLRLNLRNPQPLEESAFKLEEGGKSLDFELESSHPSTDDVHKSVLILWEYLPAKARDAQNKYFRQVLLQALPGILEEGDELNIATFAWTDQKKGEGIITQLQDGFSADTLGLGQAVFAAKAPGGKGIDAAHGSELFPAIAEGINLLAAQKNQAKLLIVLSAEFPNIFNPGGDVAMVTDKARKSDVSICNLRYKLMAEKYSLDDVALNTYGQSFEVDPKDANGAANQVQKMAQEASSRALGMDYALTFKTESPRDGKVHSLQITAGTESLTAQYHAPALGLGGWIQENLLLFISLIVLVLAIIGGILYFMRQKGIQEAARQAEEHRKLQEVESRAKENAEKLQQQTSAMDRIQMEEKARQRALSDAQRKAEAEAEAKVLLQEMYANGRQPRLTTMVNGQPLTMDLPSPVTTVGRDPSCDVQIADPTISRTHFQVIYQQGKYTLLDLGSTNGTLLNGQRAHQVELRHGDQLQAGGATLFFYI